MRICWIAHRKNLPTLEPLRAMLAEPEFASYELVTVSNDAAADVIWSDRAAVDVLRASHVGVVPVRDDSEIARVASANRVVALMAAGLPAVADRLPAYEEVVDHGVTGFLCDSPDAWRSALRELLDPGRRLTVGTAARAAVDPAFRPETTSEAWLAVFDALGPGTSARRARLGAYARLHASATYARAGLDRYYGLGVVVPQALRAVTAAPAAPGGLRVAAKLVRDIVRPVGGRVRAAVARRVRRR